MADTVQNLDPLDYVESLEGLTLDSMPRFTGLAVRYDANEGEAWHYHEVGHLLYAISGTMRVSTRENIVLIPPTMAAWLPPGIHHQLEPLTTTELRIIFARPDTLPIDDSRGRLLAVSPLLRELILSFVSPSMTDASARRRTALNEIFSVELAESTEIPLSLPMPSDKRIQPMADKALANPGEITSVSAWAVETPASRKTVERLFLEETGLLPSQWLRQARLIKAVSELAKGRSVSSVAVDLGYATPSSFTYMFRQALGVPPSKFLRGGATLRSRFGE
jgi:AraC-like DNA-binding protein/mannose-6-phosphate isomerase-like protein (cupin superfamily)